LKKYEMSFIVKIPGVCTSEVSGSQGRASQTSLRHRLSVLSLAPSNAGRPEHRGASFPIPRPPPKASSPQPSEAALRVRLQLSKGWLSFLHTLRDVDLEHNLLLLPPPLLPPGIRGFSNSSLHSPKKRGN